MSRFKKRNDKKRIHRSTLKEPFRSNIWLLKPTGLLFAIASPILIPIVLVKAAGREVWDDYWKVIRETFLPVVDDD